MQSLQLRYSALQFFYYVATCAACAFVTVVLQYRGLDNTQVGVVTASACVLSVLVGPMLSRVAARFSLAQVARLFDVEFIAMEVLFAAIIVAPLPIPAVMAAYILLYGAIMISAPLTSRIAIDYLRAGKPINFGLARGMGSVSYAICAALAGQGVNVLGPAVLLPVFVISAAAFLISMHALPPIAPREAEGTPPTAPSAPARGRGVAAFVARYRLLMLILVGFGFAYSASSCLSIYLINIVISLGGDVSLYGIGIFLNAMSELPFMALVPRLRRRFGTGALLMVAAVAYLARNLLISFAPSLPVVFLGLAFQGLSFGTLTSLLTYYVGETCEEADGMLGQTLIAIMTSGFGSMAGNYLGGRLQDTLGLDAMFVYAAACTVIGAAVLVAGGVLERRRASVAAARRAA